MSPLCRCRYNSEQVVGLVDDYEQRSLGELLLWAQVSTKTSHLAPEGSSDDSSEAATPHTKAMVHLVCSTVMGPSFDEDIASGT